MQKIVIFIEPRYANHHIPSKIGNLFLNRFAIDEDESNEIVKIINLNEKYFKFGNLNQGLDLIRAVDYYFINLSSRKDDFW